MAKSHKIPFLQRNILITSYIINHIQGWMNVAWMPDHSSSFPPPVLKGHRAQVGREEICASTANNIESTSTSCCKIHSTAQLSIFYILIWASAVSWGTWQAAEKAGRVKTAAVPIPCQTYKKLPAPIFSSFLKTFLQRHQCSVFISSCHNNTRQSHCWTFNK